MIEKRDVTHGGPWVPAALNVPANATSHTVPKLIEGTKYEFRVRAENAQGTSDPLETIVPVTAKNPFGLYDIALGKKKFQFYQL